MEPTVFVFLASLSVSLAFYVRRVGFNLSGTSVLLGLLLALHGPAYLYYTRVWGPDTDFFDLILSAAPGEDVIGRLDIALAICFALVCLGIAAADRAHRVTPARLFQALREWSTTPMRCSPASRSMLVIVCSVMAVAVLLPFVAIDSQPSKVFEYVLSDLGELDKILLRREGGGSGVYLYNLLLSAVLPFFAYALLAACIQGRHGLTVLLVAFAGLVLMGKAATLSKAPPVVFLLQLFTVYWMTRSLRIDRSMALKLGGLTTGLFFFASVVANPTFEGAALVFEFLFYRVFMIVNEGLVEYFAAIPFVIPHSWGTQLSWVAGIFQSTPSLPTYWLVGEVHRGGLGSTTTVLFIGDAWADFAWAGVAGVSFLMGFVVRSIDIQLLTRRRKSVAVVAGLAAMHFGIFTALNTSFSTALVTGGLLFVVPLVALLTPRARTSLRASAGGAQELAAARVEGFVVGPGISQT